MSIDFFLPRRASKIRLMEFIEKNLKKFKKFSKKEGFLKFM
jgi:ribosomal protein S21